MLEAIGSFLTNIYNALAGILDSITSTFEYVATFLDYLFSIDFTSLTTWLPPMLAGVVASIISLYIVIRILELI